MHLIPACVLESIASRWKLLWQKNCWILRLIVKLRCLIFFLWMRGRTMEINLLCAQHNPPKVNNSTCAFWSIYAWWYLWCAVRVLWDHNSLNVQFIFIVDDVFIKYFCMLFTHIQRISCVFIYTTIYHIHIYLCIYIYYMYVYIYIVRGIQSHLYFFLQIINNNI